MLGRLAAAHALACALTVALTCAPAYAGGSGGAGGSAPFELATNGERPDVAVDEEGNGHFVWNEVAADNSPDVTHYCRVPRGRRECDIHHRLIPQEPGDPRFNDDTGGPEVVLFGPEQVAVMTFRYPNVVTVGRDGTRDQDCYSKHPLPSDYCHGTSAKTYGFYSIDNGATFGTEDVFSHRDINGDVASFLADVPSPADPSQMDQAPVIGTITDTVSGGTWFASAPPLGYVRESINLGDGGPDRAYSGRIAVQDDKLPIATFAGLDSSIYLRRWSGTSPINNIATWPSESKVATGSDPRIAGGPGGIHLAYKPRNGNNFIVRAVNGLNVGSQTPLSTGGATLNPALFGDDGGTLHGAWVRRDGGAREQLLYRFAPDGSTFSPAQLLADNRNGETWNVGLGAAEDGGGFAVFSSTISGNGRIAAMPFGSQRPRRLIDARVSAIEVTQAIQNAEGVATRPVSTGAAANTVAYRGVPLAANDTTVVRVYAKLRRALRPFTRRPAMTLRVYRDGRQLPGPYLPDKTGPMPVEAGDAVSAVQRADVNAAWTFTLPWQAATGTLTLEAEINPEGLRPSLAECRRCRGDNKLRVTGIPFRPTRPVRVIPVSITIAGQKPTAFPDSASPFAGVRAVAPMRVDVEPYRGDIDITDIQNVGTITDESCFLGVFPCDSETRTASTGDKTNLALLRMWDWADDNIANFSVYPIGVMRGGLLGAGGTTSGGAMNGGRLYGQGQTAGIVTDNRPLTSVAHEFFHGLGRVHAGRTCGSNSNGQVGEAWPPNDDGALAPGEVGLDRRPGVPFRTIMAGAAGQPGTYFDLMSYCPPGGGSNENDHWMSVRNWTRALEENPAARTASGGFAARVAAARPAQAKALRVLAMVPAGGKPTIVTVTPDDGAPTAIDPANGLRLVGRDASGNEVTSAGAVIRTVHQDGIPDAQVISGRVSAAGVAAVDIEQDGLPVAQQLASKNAPKVSITSPRRGATVGGKGNVSFRWKASDADGDALLAIVEYSANGGRGWEIVKVGPSTGSAAVPARLLAASRNARLRVRVQDGFHEAVATSQRFTTRGAPPAVDITTPRNGTAFEAGASVPLAGEAYGAAGKKIGGRSLIWRDGKRVIGRGERITLDGIAPGKRKISLTATQRGGPAGTARITLRVSSATPHFTLLETPSRIGRKARRLRIRAATSFATRLTVRGQRFRLDRKPRGITIRIPASRKFLSLELKLGSGRSSATEFLLIPRR